LRKKLEPNERAPCYNILNPGSVIALSRGFEEEIQKISASHYHYLRIAITISLI
jgi:hypothetical protein